MADEAGERRQWEDRIGEAEADRAKYEPTWQSNLAFAAGKHWLRYNRSSRKLEVPADLRPALAKGDLYTADVITERRMAALGELASDDDRPTLLLLDRDGQLGDDYQAAANRAVEYGWDKEWHGDEVLAEADRLCIDLGTSAVRCRFDATAGPVKQDHVPFENGQPILDMEQARAYAERMVTGGQVGDFRQVNEGRIVWEPLSAFNMLVPPGVPHERDLPWLIIKRPVTLDKAQQMFPAAEGLKEDGDIASLFGFDAGTDEAAYGAPGTSDRQTRQQHLKDHIWLYTCLAKPTRQYPAGRTVVLGGGEKRILDIQGRLPYLGPDQTPRFGVAFFHWWRVTGRFWSRGLVEAMKDPQRHIDRRKTQATQIIDRSMPFMLVEEGNEELANRAGLPMEIVALKKPGQGGAPIVVAGPGPGDWMYKDIESMREDLDHATGIYAPRLGDNPANVKTYGQLMLLTQTDQGKRGPIYKARRDGVAQLVEDSVYDIRRYWGEEKLIALAGDDDRIESETFNATKIPDFYIVKVGKGASPPRNPAAETQKIEQIAEYGAKIGQPPPLRWYAESLDAAQAQELPPAEADAQKDLAQLENLKIAAGEDVPVFYADDPLVHIPEHREKQIEARSNGNIDLEMALEEHIREHLVAAAQNIQGAPPPPPDPNAPPSVAPSAQ